MYFKPWTHELDSQATWTDHHIGYGVRRCAEASQHIGLLGPPCSSTESGASDHAGTCKAVCGSAQQRPLRVSARAKPRTEWLGGRVLAGRGGRMKVCTCVRSGSFRAHLRWLSGRRARGSRLGCLAARGCSSEAPSTTPVMSASFSDPTCEPASTCERLREKVTRGALESTRRGLSNAYLPAESRRTAGRRGGSQERI